MEEQDQDVIDDGSGLTDAGRRTDMGMPCPYSRAPVHCLGMHQFEHPKVIGPAQSNMRLVRTDLQGVWGRFPNRYDVRPAGGALCQCPRGIL